MKTAWCTILLFLFSAGISAGQSHKIDSLRKALPLAKDDTARAGLMLSLASDLETINPDSSLLLSKQALDLSYKNNWHKGIIGSLYDIGVFQYVKGDLNGALQSEDSALAFCTRTNDKLRLNSIYNMLGNITSDQDKYAQGLDYYFKALAIDSTVTKKSVADLYNNIGLDYQDIGNYVKAEEYYFKALREYEATNNQEGIGTISNNLGNLYDLRNEYDKGLVSKEKSMHIDSIAGNLENLEFDYQNIGHSYLMKKNEALSLTYSYRSLELAHKLNIVAQIYVSYSNIADAFIDVYFTDSLRNEISYEVNGHTVTVKRSDMLDSVLFNEKRSIYFANKAGNRATLITAYKDIADIYRHKKDIKTGLAFYKRAYDLADSIGLLQEKMEESQAYGHALAEAGDYKQAYLYINNSLALKDSLYGEQKQKAIGNIEAQYDFDTKILEQKKENEKEKAVAAEQEKRQTFVIVGVSIGLLIVLVFLFILFKRFKVTDRQKKIIEEQKKDVDAAYGELNNAHAELQEKDKDITDSIAYARKIQSAILPSEEILKEQLNDCFVLYKPRDVVSGDFYWSHTIGDKSIFAVVDCTGHGVPGAFMSMIGNSLLNQVVIENKITTSDGILEQMRENLVKQTQQKGQESLSRDGMDMSVCVWDRKKNTIQYSGANNPLYLLRKNVNATIQDNPKLRPHGTDLLEILPDKQPIGYQEGKMDSAFTSYTIEVQSGDLIYIASDGYQDQFGGEKNKKFTSRAFRDLLVSLIDKPIDMQKQILNGTIETWKGTYAQTDDICVMGLKIS